MKKIDLKLSSIKYVGFVTIFMLCSAFFNRGSTLYANNLVPSIHLKGVTLTKVSEMINLLEPIAGSFAVTIFTIGLVAAGVSSQFPNMALLPWLLDDYHERKADLTRLDYRIFALVISLLGLVVPLFNAKPIVIMILSQAFGALVLPVTVACIIYLGNQKDLMKDHTFSLLLNIIFISNFSLCYFNELFELFMYFSDFELIVTQCSKLSKI